MTTSPKSAPEASPGPLLVVVRTNRTSVGRSICPDRVVRRWISDPPSVRRMESSDFWSSSAIAITRPSRATSRRDTPECLPASTLAPRTEFLVDCGPGGWLPSPSQRSRCHGRRAYPGADGTGVHSEAPPWSDEYVALRCDLCRADMFGSWTGSRVKSNESVRGGPGADAWDTVGKVIDEVRAVCHLATIVVDDGLRTERPRGARTRSRRHAP